MFNGLRPKIDAPCYPPLDRPGALYVHVPFCRAKCRYCDFYSMPLDAPLADRYVRAVRAELESHRAQLRTPLDSVFVGGGTPSVLGPVRLGDLLETIRPLTSAETEWTVEVNPGTVDDELARCLRQAGVNRVSVGAQSFDPDELRLLGRIGSSA